MKKEMLAATALAAAVLVGCTSGGDTAGGPAATTTTATATLSSTATTADPEPVIRRYASAVAPAHARFTSDKTCSARSTCAMEMATAWANMMNDLDDLDDPPEEIAPLVAGLHEVNYTFRPYIDAITGCIEDYQAMGDPVAGLTECDPLVTVFETMWASEAAAALERWGPYL